MSPSSANTGRKANPLWLVYGLFAVLTLALIFIGMRATLADSPIREAVAALEPYGLVTVRFSTDPHPALPTGTVGLSFSVVNDRRLPVEVDWARVEYGMEGNDEPVGASEAQPMDDGSGMLMAQAQFPQVGRWWLRFELGKGSSQAEVRFTFYVEPAQ